MNHGLALIPFTCLLFISGCIDPIITEEEPATAQFQLPFFDICFKAARGLINTN